MARTEADAHWAPPQLVLATRLLTHAGHLQVAWDGDDRSGGRGVPGRLTPSAPLPPVHGVYALVEDGAVRYVGYAEHLARTFGARGLGRAAGAKDCDDPRRAEECRLQHLVLDAARRGVVIDVYLLTDPEPELRRWWQRRTVAATSDLAQVAAQIGAAVRGTWQDVPRPAAR